MRTTLTLILLLAPLLSGCDLFREGGEDTSHPRGFFPLAVGNEWHHHATSTERVGSGPTTTATERTRRRVVAAEGDGRFRVEITTIRETQPDTTTREVTWYYNGDAIFEVSPNGVDFLVGCTLDAEHEARDASCNGPNATGAPPPWGYTVTAADQRVLSIGGVEYPATTKDFASSWSLAPGSDAHRFARGIGWVSHRANWVQLAPGSGPNVSHTRAFDLRYARVGEQGYGSPLAF